MKEKLLEEKRKIEKALLEIFNTNQGITDEEILEMIENYILEHYKNEQMSIFEKQELKKELFNRFRRLDILSPLLEDNEISEIMINGKDNIFIEKKGKLIKIEDQFSSEERLRNVIQQIVSSCNRIVNESVPIVDARLNDGSRVNVVLPPIAIDGPTMTIRKFQKEFFTMEKLIELGTLNEEIAAFLKMMVRGRYNIFISGGTGSGKTTFLNVLSNFIPKEERIIVIEDSAELQIQNIPNLVRMETRNANVEGDNIITMSELIKAALRMRPTRIVIGEVRDAAAMDMATSMLTGHDGSISTGHGNSSKEMMLRLETMILTGYDMPILAIRQQIAAAIDIVIHVGRLRDNSRRMLEISEVLGVENGEIQMQVLYKFVEKEELDGKIIGEWIIENSLKNKLKLIQRGIKYEND